MLELYNHIFSLYTMYVTGGGEGLLSWQQNHDKWTVLLIARRGILMS